MRLRQEHLNLMVCPVCHGALQLSSDEEAIDCSRCGRRYPIVDDLPILISSRATLPTR